MVKNKKGAISLVLIILFVVLVGLGGYAYYKGNKTNPNASITQKLTGGLTSVVESVTPETKSEELNYKFNFDANFEALENSKKVASGELKLKNGEIVTKEKSLKQSLKIDEISGNIQEENKENINFSFKDFAAISDNEITYFYTGEGYEKLIDFYKKISEQNPMLSIDTINSVEKAYKEKKYIKIDNSKPVLRILGKLSENDLIKKLAIGAVTTNPKAYYEKTGVTKDLKELFASDFVINYIFKDGDYNEETKKSFLSLNDRICTDISPIIGNIAKEFDQKEIDIKNFEKECKDGIKQVNGVLPMIIQIYKEGDVKSGNYKFVVSQGIILKLEIDYKKHILDTYSLALKDPANRLELAFSGDKNRLKTSLLKLDIDENGIKINGEIKDGTGKITINGKQEKVFDINGNISFDKYKPSYDLTTKSEIAKSEFVAKGDYKEGKITAKQEEKEVFKLDYAKEKCDLKIDKEDLQLQANYKNKVFDLDLKGRNGLVGKAHAEKGKISFNSTIKEYNGVTKTDFNYDNGKINGTLKNSNTDAKLTGDFKNCEDFNIVFVEEKEKTNIVAKSEKISPKENKITVVGKQKEKEKFNMNITRKIGEKEGYKTCELKGKILVVDDKKEFNFNINSNYKKGGVKFEIPTNAEEINIKLMEISTLPDFNMGARLKEMGLENVKLVIGGVTVGAILGTVAFISIENTRNTYTQGAKNAKVHSDLQNISMKIAITGAKGEFTLNDLVLEGNKINFEKLGENEENFKNPYGGDYLLFVKGDKYEVYGITINDAGEKVALIRGTYYPENDEEPESLVEINGKIIKNGDIVE